MYNPCLIRTLDGNRTHVIKLVEMDAARLFFPSTDICDECEASSQCPFGKQLPEERVMVRVFVLDQAL
jgi:hypothetical protein